MKSQSVPRAGKSKVVPILIVMVIVFLLGFIPQYLKVREARNELAAAQMKLGLAGIRDLAGTMYFDTSQKNYGLAAQDSSSFFNQVRALRDKLDNPDLRATLESFLQKQDAITAELAKGDPAALAEVQNLYQAAQKNLKY